MQRIERYGVLALVFLLVTIVTFALWDDGSKPADGELAAAGPQERTQTPARPADVRRRQSSTDGLKQQRAADEARRQARLLKLADAESHAGKNSLQGKFKASAAAAELANRTKNSSAGNGFATTQPKTASNNARPVNHKLVISQDPADDRAKSLAAQQAEADRRRLAREEKDRLLRNGTEREHTVASGETLGHISAKYYGTTKSWRSIADANPGVNPNALGVGQKLVIPARGAVPTPVAHTTVKTPTPKKTVSGPGGRYTVQSGDVLSRIAEREVGSVKDVKRILAMNPGLDANRLVIGQVLAMPTASAGSNRTAVASAASTRPTAKRNDRPRVH